MMKRCMIPPSSSSCTESPITEKMVSQKSLIPPKIKPNKPVRAKKIANAAENSATSPKSRSSIYRGVKRCWYRYGRYEARLWVNSTWNSTQNKRGRRIYLGGYDNEDYAARTYDLAALKYCAPTTVLNFPLDTYTKDLEEMEKLTKDEYIAMLRRRSTSFSRGVSKYRGVARHNSGRWEARIQHVTEKKLFLGTYSTQEEAAAAYDMAAIEFRGPNAVTNFDISHYAEKLKQILPDMQVKEEEPQVMEEIIPDSCNLAQPDEPHDHDHDHDQQHDENQVQSNIPKLESIDAIDGLSMVMMDLTEAREHPWDLCLDNIGFNMLPIPDIPLESDFYGLFNGKGFGDDIELMLNGTYDSEVVQDAISATDGYKMEADLLPGRELKKMKVADVSHSTS